MPVLVDFGHFFIGESNSDLTERGHLLEGEKTLQMYTVKVVSIGTDRCEQTVRPRSDCSFWSSLIRVYTVCYSIPTFLNAFLQCKTTVTVIMIVSQFLEFLR